MRTSPTYGELLCENAVLKEQNRRLDEHVAYLERLLYGLKSDRIASRIPDSQPGQFDRLFQQAMDEKVMQTEQAGERNLNGGAKASHGSRKVPVASAQILLCRTGGAYDNTYARRGQRRRMRHHR